MIDVKVDKNIMLLISVSEDISYRKEFDRSKQKEYFNIANVEFITDMILSEIFDISKICSMRSVEIMKYMRIPNIKKIHIYLYPETHIAEREVDDIGVETKISEYIPNDEYTLSNLLYKFDRDVMNRFDQVIQNVLKVIDRDKIKVIYHFKPTFLRLTHKHKPPTHNDEVFVKTIHQNSIYFREW